MQPVPQDAAVCRHCSMPRQRSQPFTISIGIVGVLALVFVLLVAITAIRETNISAAPPAQDQQAVLPR